MTFPADKFLRRFLLHVLPQGFVRTRHFGIFARRRRRTLLQLCFQLFQAPAPTPTQPVQSAHATSSSYGPVGG